MRLEIKCHGCSKDQVLLLANRTNLPNKRDCEPDAVSLIRSSQWFHIHNVTIGSTQVFLISLVSLNNAIRVMKIHIYYGCERYLRVYIDVKE